MSAACPARLSGGTMRDDDVDLWPADDLEIPAGLAQLYGLTLWLPLAFYGVLALAAAGGAPEHWGLLLERFLAGTR